MIKYILLIFIIISFSYSNEIQTIVSKSENNTESEQKFREAKKLERQGMINQS